MIIDKKTIERLHREGIKFTGKNGETITPQRTVTPRREATELDQLRTIASLLEVLIAKPTPTASTVSATSPNVTVTPPEVIVNVPEINVPPPPPRIRKWKFAIERDFSGHAVEITATAVE